MKKSTRERFDKIINKEMDNIEKLQANQYYEVEDLEKAYANLERLAKLEEEIANAKKSRRIELFKSTVTIIAQVAVPIITIIAYDGWLTRGLEFEETGTIGNSMNRTLLSTMLPKNKV